MSLIQIRDAYGQALLKLGKQNKKVVVLDADVGSSTKSMLFSKEFPERYFNVGAAEFGMLTEAAGMSTLGFIPFTNSFAVFTVLRGGDAINLIGYDKLNVKIVGSYAGLSAAYDGATHHGTMDLALLQAIPTMTILSPSSPLQTEQAVFAAATFQGPVYLRLSREAMPEIYNSTSQFEIGKGHLLRSGTDVTIVATGMMVSLALEAAKLLAETNIQVEVIDISTIKPLDTELILKSARKTQAVIVAEEHNVFGGLGSSVAQLLATTEPTPMRFIALTEYSESGGYQELLEKNKLDVSTIIANVHELIK